MIGVFQLWLTVSNDDGGKEELAMAEQKELSEEDSLTFVNQLDPAPCSNQELLASLCIRSPYYDVRMRAVDKLTHSSLLAKIATCEVDYEVSKAAVEKLVGDDFLGQVAGSLCKNRYICILALRRIKDATLLLHIAQTHVYAEFHMATVGCIDDPAHLLQVAENDTDFMVREVAVKKAGRHGRSRIDYIP